MCQLLHRLGIRSRRAHAYLHSPDPDYAAKVAYLHPCWQPVLLAPTRLVLLYGDEFAFARQPSLASAYEAQGALCPLAQSD